MKKILIGIGCFITILVLNGWVWAQPIITVEEPTYTFEPVIEGSRIVHTFVVKNTGDATFNIIKTQGP